MSTMACVRPHLRELLLEKLACQVAAASRVAQNKLEKAFGKGAYKGVFTLSTM
jgi:hypothetical protein